MSAIELELELEHCRAALDAWLLEAYAGVPNDGEFGRPYFGERDIGYENWPTIYRVVGQVFTERLWSSLPAPRRHDIVFFISRENEGGAIISWLNSAVGGPLSNVGDLSPDDFVAICRTCLELDEDCADYVLASKLATLSAPRVEHFEVLERFFSRTSSYTRRRALMSLDALGAAGVFEKAEALFWAPNADQWDQAICLSIMSKLAGQQNDFAQWLSRAQTLDAQSAKGLIERFRIARVERGFGEN